MTPAEAVCHFLDLPLHCRVSADAVRKSPDSGLVETAEAEAFFKTPNRNWTVQISNYGEVELPRALILLPRNSLPFRTRDCLQAWGKPTDLY